MKTSFFKSGWRSVVLVVLMVPVLSAQTITGVSNQGRYTGAVTFTVAAEDGFDITATLNGDPVPVGAPHLVDRMDFYELIAERTPVGGGTMTSNTPENSRIHLAGELEVPAGASLTIGEGSVVKIDPGVEIVTGGAITINGTPERPVVLTSIGHVAPEVHANA